VIGSWLGEVLNMEIEIQPHQGIGPISFGMTRDEVAVVMARKGGGKPEAKGKETDCYYDASFQVSFGDLGRADFIEAFSSLALKFDVVFREQNVFNLSADELLAFLQLHDRTDLELSRPPGEYIFAELILTLWGRDKQYDHLGGGQRTVFSAIGIGAPTYLEAIRAIRRRHKRRA
jgi:hypothetical protein